MNKLRLLHSYPTEFEAELVKTKLEREGIESVIEADDVSNMLPSLDYASGYQIFVEPDDYPSALALVESTVEGLTDDMDTGTGD